MERARRSRTLNTALLLLWLNFIFLWDRVHQVTDFKEVLASAGLMGGMISVYGAILALWVYHNVRIWRMKGPRLNLREVSSVITHDALRRPISRAIDLERGQDIRVTVLGNRKLFSNGALPPLGLDFVEPEVQEV
jgi:hypothetical protein